MHTKAKIKEEKFLFEQSFRKKQFLKLSFFFLFRTAKEDLMISRWTQTEKWETHICSFAPQSNIILSYFFSYFSVSTFFLCYQFASLEMNKFKFLIVHAFVIALRWVRVEKDVEEGVLRYWAYFSAAMHVLS